MPKSTIKPIATERERETVRIRLRQCLRDVHSLDHVGLLTKWIDETESKIEAIDSERLYPVLTAGAVPSKGQDTLLEIDHKRAFYVLIYERFKIWNASESVYVDPPKNLELPLEFIPVEGSFRDDVWLLWQTIKDLATKEKYFVTSRLETLILENLARKPSDIESAMLWLQVIESQVAELTNMWTVEGMSRFQFTHFAEALQKFVVHTLQFYPSYTGKHFAPEIVKTAVRDESDPTLKLAEGLQEAIKILRTAKTEAGELNVKLKVDRTVLKLREHYNVSVDTVYLPECLAENFASIFKTDGFKTVTDLRANQENSSGKQLAPGAVVGNIRQSNQSNKGRNRNRKRGAQDGQHDRGRRRNFQGKISCYRCSENHRAAECTLVCAVCSKSGKCECSLTVLKRERDKRERDPEDKVAQPQNKKRKVFWGTSPAKVEK